MLWIHYSKLPIYRANLFLSNRKNNSFVFSKRVRLTVPSSILWQRFLAETQANRPFQKLRNNLLMLLQLTLGAVELQMFELLNPTRLIFTQIIHQSRFTDPKQLSDLPMAQALTFEIYRFHFPLHSWMGVMEAFIV